MTRSRNGVSHDAGLAERRSPLIGPCQVRCKIAKLQLVAEPSTINVFGNRLNLAKGQASGLCPRSPLTGLPWLPSSLHSAAHLQAQAVDSHGAVQLFQKKTFWLATFLFRLSPKMAIGRGQSPCFFPAGLNYFNHGFQLGTHQSFLTSTWCVSQLATPSVVTHIMMASFTHQVVMWSRAWGLRSHSDVAHFGGMGMFHSVVNAFPGYFF